ncbi:MAG: AI-2E family transporter [Desulfopila sp.]
MDLSSLADRELEKRLARLILDVLIRAGLVLVMVMLCYTFFAPFLSMMLWALILAVTLFPLHQRLANRLGKRQGLASIVLIVVSVVLIVIPTTVLVSSLADTIHSLIGAVRDNSLTVPPPLPAVADWPVIGDRAYALWSQAHSDLPAVVASMQPKIGDLAKHLLSIVAGLGGKVLLFLFSFIVAGIIMAFGAPGGRTTRLIFERVVGIERGAPFARLATGTIRAVAAGVIGIAAIQALLIGLILLVAGIPGAGLLALVVLIVGIAQLPMLLVSLPIIGYVWYVGDYGTGMAIFYTVLLIVAGTIDNVLKPLMLGRGVDAPMPIILLGALGGMASNGILGMFIGATLLALGYQIFTRWVKENPELPLPSGQ